MPEGAKPGDVLLLTKALGTQVRSSVNIGRIYHLRWDSSLKRQFCWKVLVWYLKYYNWSGRCQCPPVARGAGGEMAKGKNWPTVLKSTGAVFRLCPWKEKWKWKKIFFRSRRKEALQRKWKLATAPPPCPWQGFPFPMSSQGQKCSSQPGCWIEVNFRSQVESDGRSTDAQAQGGGSHWCHRVRRNINLVDEEYQPFID